MEMKPFEETVYLSSPTMHGDEIKYIQEAYDTNWMSTIGANINEAEKMICQKVGCADAVALSAGTAALHLAIKLAGERLYGQPMVRHLIVPSASLTSIKAWQVLLGKQLIKSYGAVVR